MSFFKVIYINGPSSSGKSSLAKALQEKIDTFFLHIGIDKMIGMMPFKTNAWDGSKAPIGYSWKAIEVEGQTLQSIQSGPYAKKISNTLKSVVKALLQDGHYVIVDDVCSCSFEQEKWIEALSSICDPKEILWVELFAHKETLLQRERARGDRMIGSSLEQALRFERERGRKRDLYLNSSVLSLEEQVQKIKEHIRMCQEPCQTPPDYLYKIISKEGWQQSQDQENLILPAFDQEFIHLATEKQLPKIVQKFWADSQGFYVLKVAYNKLKGKCIFEANPGGENKYYHLYEGAVPLESIEGFVFFESAEVFLNSKFSSLS